MQITNVVLLSLIEGDVIPLDSTIYNYNRYIDLSYLCILRDKCVIYVTLLEQTSYSVNLTTEKHLVDI